MSAELPDMSMDSFLMEGKMPDTVEELQAKFKEITEAKDDLFKLMILMKKVLAKNPRARLQLVTELGGTLPHNKSHGYYNKKAATFIKPHVDKMIEDNYNAICFPYVDYNKIFSRNSLRLFLFHGLRFLIDTMDTPELKYEQFRNNTMFKVREVGVYITKKTEMELKQVVRSADNVESSEQWKPALMNYLENSEPGESFHKKGLLLSEADIEYVNVLLEGNIEFEYTVTVDKIKVIHLKIDDK